MTLDVNGYKLEPVGGEHLWSLNCLLSMKAGGPETHEAFTVAELVCPPGFGPPPHLDHDEDEIWYILDGEASFVCGDKRSTATAGSCVMAPRAIEHTFMTWDQGPVKMLQQFAEKRQLGGRWEAMLALARRHVSAEVVEAM